MNFSEGRQGGCGRTPRTPLNPPLVSSQPTPSAVDITPLALAAEHRRRAACSTAGALSTAPAIYPAHTALDSKPAARRCCWRPEYGARSAPAALQQYILPTGRSTANPPLLLSNDGTDRQTDGRTDAGPLHSPCSAYYARSVKSKNSTCT